MQARVRGGESAELIAAETGWPLDKVMRYAEPLLAERVFIAEQARAVEVRRSGGGATLQEAAYAAIGDDPEAGSIAWDAWRREDGKWIISAAYVDGTGSHQARWTYDHVGRNLHPLDDDARTLMGARPIAVPDPEMDIAAALDLVADIPVVREEAVVEMRPHLVAVPDADDDEFEDASAVDDGLVTEIIEITEVVEVTQIVEVADEDQTLFGEPTPIAHPSTTHVSPEPVVEEAPAPVAPAAKPAARKPKTRKGRASVPSWDEILFGATKSDD